MFELIFSGLLVVMSQWFVDWVVVDENNSLLDTIKVRDGAGGKMGARQRAREAVGFYNPPADQGFLAKLLTCKVCPGGWVAIPLAGVMNWAAGLDWEQNVVVSAVEVLGGMMLMLEYWARQDARDNQGSFNA